MADTAVIIGDTTIGKDCSIWFGAVLRGDVNKITIGDRTNIQDGAVIHTLYDKSPKPSQTHIGNDVSVGHNATIHGATKSQTRLSIQVHSYTQTSYFMEGWNEAEHRSPQTWRA